jgi:endonuclease G, mitochondrial
MTHREITPTLMNNRNNSTLQRLIYSVIPIVLLAITVSAADINYIPQSANKDIIRHKYYTLSYIDRYKDAEWVAYKIEGYMTVGTAKRSNKFKYDPAVILGSALPVDYLKSGYDKGHLCPAADMKWDAEAMDETFYMSNISPQEPGFNRGIWKDLEEQVRQWAVELKKVYVVTGLILNSKLPTIGKINRVAVPKYIYKIVLQYDDQKSKAIAFLIPNEPSSTSLVDFVVPIDSIQSLTKINFFPSLTDKQCENLEKKIDVSKWHFNNKKSRNKIKPAYSSLFKN